MSAGPLDSQFDLIKSAAPASCITRVHCMICCPCAVHNCMDGTCLMSTLRDMIR